MTRDELQLNLSTIFTPETRQHQCEAEQAILAHDAAQRQVIAEQAAQIQRLRNILRALVSRYYGSLSCDLDVQILPVVNDAQQALKETTP